MDTTVDTSLTQHASVSNGVVAPDTGSRPVVEPPVLGGSEHTDYYHLDALLTDEHRALKARVRALMHSAVAPILNRSWERAEFPSVRLSNRRLLYIPACNIPTYV